MSQGHISKETVADAYIHYFDELILLNNLNIIDAYYADVSAINGTQKTIFIIGQTRSIDSLMSYYRQVLLADNGVDIKQ